MAGAVLYFKKVTIGTNGKPYFLPLSPKMLNSYSKNIKNEQN